MPIDSGAHQRSVADQRVLRYAFGTSTALLISQIMNWQMSYLAAVFTATFLALPIAPPRLKGGLVFLGLLGGSLLLGMLVLGPVKRYELPGLLLLSLLFFGVFYYSLRGGSALVVSLAVAGLAVVPVVGVASSAAAIAVCESMLKAGLVALLMLWLFHALFPDPLTDGAAAPSAAAPATSDSAASLAMRSTLVVMPVIIWLLATMGTSYLAVAIKVSSMGQQACMDSSRQAGSSLLLSTLIGGAAAITIWSLLRIWPSLILYTLLVLLAGLIIGRRVFAGSSLAPSGQTWSYGYVTLLIILGPAVMDSGDAAGSRFFDRIFMFACAATYSVFAVWFFDTIISRRRRIAAS
jgi:hypothetical protein